MRACEADLREAAKALAKDFPVCAAVCDQSADYVRELEQQLELANLDCMEKAQRLDSLEQQLADLREALESIAANTCCDSCQEAALVAKVALQGGVKDDS